ncbi:hypothetical protein E3N88_28949 [Mikania micrantha]|uniref:Uncharacterized protein n=1 Tax=Mikania micrantha TaxID=192012 RepID=A0A5N6N188_9ASTR|nr:hypothetical protein E3N88_28949 [Mikania micrantha]
MHRFLLLSLLNSPGHIARGEEPTDDEHAIPCGRPSISFSGGCTLQRPPTRRLHSLASTCDEEAGARQFCPLPLQARRDKEDCLQCPLVVKRHRYGGFGYSLPIIFGLDGFLVKKRVVVATTFVPTLLNLMAVVVCLAVAAVDNLEICQGSARRVCKLEFAISLYLDKMRPSIASDSRRYASNDVTKSG